MNRLMIVLMALVACGAPKKTAKGLAPGDLVAVSVASSPQGLTASAIVAEVSAADDPGGVDCQNGLDPSGKPCDGGPATNPDDGSPEPAGTPSAASQVVVPTALLAANGRGDFNAFGMTIAAASQLPAGVAVRFVGALAAKGLFMATATRASTAISGRLVGRIESLTHDKGGAGVSLRILGRSVHASSDLPLALVDSVEAAADKDADGVICQQDGQHDGENAGCTPPPK